MTQTTGEYPTATRPTPTKMKVGTKVFLGIAVLFLAGAFLGTNNSDDSDSPSSGSGVYASAGWTAARVVDLEFDLRRDAGFSDAKAECAMRSLVGGTTWLEWQATSKAGQLVTIAAAGRAC